MDIRTATYQPGVCNIGPEEIARRRRAGIAGLTVAMGLAALLVVVGAPREARWLVALPAAGAATGFLQARARFCAAYGFRGLQNLGRLGEQTAVADPAARRTDIRRSLEIAAAAGAIGVAASIVFVLLPA